MHHEAMDCAAKSRALLKEGDVDLLQYAALQARMGIEHLFYELVPMYRDELPVDVLKNWQPQRIIAALLDCDPSAEVDINNLVMFQQNKDASQGPPVAMGGQTAVTRRLLRDHYHKLGKYLHAPTEQVPHDPGRIRSAVEATLESLDRYASDRIMSNIATKIEVTCDYCGHKFLRRTAALQELSEFQCTGVTAGQRCEAQFSAHRHDGDEWTIAHVMRAIPCARCSVENEFPIHVLRDRQTLVCCACNAEFQLRFGFQAVPLDRDPNSASDSSN